MKFVDDLMCILHSSTHIIAGMRSFLLLLWWWCMPYARVKNCHVLKQTRDAAINEQGQERE